MAHRQSGPVIPRTQEFYDVALYLSRFSELAQGQKRKTIPPRRLKAKSWDHAYEMFFEGLGNGRTLTSFKRSLKNARDAFDGYEGSKVRQGWKSVQNPSDLAAKSMKRYLGVEEEKFWTSISGFANPDIKDFRSLLPDLLDKSAVDAALQRIERDGYQPHGKNHTYEVVWNGQGFPPLAVLAFALEHQTGVVFPPKTLRGEYKSREFDLLRQAGLKIGRLQIDGDSEDNVHKKLKRVRSARAGNPGSDRPTKTSTNVVSIVRDEEVVLEVLKRSKGICEGCGMPAPFTRKSTGEPYLEVHHVIPLANDGPDRVWNAAALCPNCHRRCHFSNDAESFNSTLYSNVRELRRP